MTAVFSSYVFNCRNTKDNCNKFICGCFCFFSFFFHTLGAFAINLYYHKLILILDNKVLKFQEKEALWGVHPH